MYTKNIHEQESHKVICAKNREKWRNMYSLLLFARFCKLFSGGFCCYLNHFACGTDFLEECDNGGVEVFFEVFAAGDGFAHLGGGDGVFFLGWHDFLTGLLREELADEIITRADDVEFATGVYNMLGPFFVVIDVIHGDYAICTHARDLELVHNCGDHGVALPYGKRVLGSAILIHAANSYDDFVELVDEVENNGNMTAVEGLESADKNDTAFFGACHNDKYKKRTKNSVADMVTKG